MAVCVESLRRLFPASHFECCLLENNEADEVELRRCEAASDAAPVLFRLHGQPAEVAETTPAALVRRAGADQLQVLGVARQVCSLRVHDSFKLRLELVPLRLRPRLADPDTLFRELRASRKSSLYLVVLSDFLPLENMDVLPGWFLSRNGWGHGRLPGVLQTPEAVLAGPAEPGDTVAQPRKRHRTKRPASEAVGKL